LPSSFLLWRDRVTVCAARSAPFGHPHPIAKDAS
jgi:hypothetical protein